MNIPDFFPQSPNNSRSTFAYVPSEIPAFVNDTYPSFTEFYSAYYQWMDKTLGVAAKSMELDLDMNDSEGQFLDATLAMLAPEFPLTIPKTAKQQLLYLAAQYHQTKGTVLGMQCLFRILYTLDTTVIQMPVAIASPDDKFNKKIIRLSPLTENRYANNTRSDLTSTSTVFPSPYSSVNTSELSPAAIVPMDDVYGSKIVIQRIVDELVNQTISINSVDLLGISSAVVIDTEFGLLIECEVDQYTNTLPDVLDVATVSFNLDGYDVGYTFSVVPILTGFSIDNAGSDYQVGNLITVYNGNCPNNVACGIVSSIVGNGRIDSIDVYSPGAFMSPWDTINHSIISSGTGASIIPELGAVSVNSLYKSNSILGKILLQTTVGVCNLGAIVRAIQNTTEIKNFDSVVQLGAPVTSSVGVEGTIVRDVDYIGQVDVEQVVEDGTAGNVQVELSVASLNQSTSSTQAEFSSVSSNQPVSIAQTDITAITESQPVSVAMTDISAATVGNPISDLDVLFLTMQSEGKTVSNVVSVDISYNEIGIVITQLN